MSFKPDGTWTALYALESNDPTTDYFKAEYDDASGQAQTVKDPAFVIQYLRGYPYTFEVSNISNNLNYIPVRFYSSDNSLNSHLDLDLTTHVMTETGDVLYSHFEYINGDGKNYGDQTITNFHLGSFANHDTLLLPHQVFANMVDLLRQTSMVGGNAVIHDQNGVDSLTPTGVTKEQMQAHPSDFTFGRVKHLIV